MLRLFLLLLILSTPTPPPGEPETTPPPRPAVTDVRIRLLAPGVVLISWASMKTVCVTRVRDGASVGCSAGGVLADVWAAPWGGAYLLTAQGVVVARPTLHALMLPVVR